MAQPDGFFRYERKLPADRPVAERKDDWEEFHQQVEESELTTQAARCMDCGTPFCHTGVLYKGAASGCPIHNLIPEWNDLVYHGLYREALKRLRLTNNFPEFTGRVCPAPCEGSCTIGSIPGQPVTIKLIEQSIIDRGWSEGWIEPDLPSMRTGKKVAIIGSGPAGLACADQLNHAGHLVTVFERADRPGGLLMYGIPNMKLPKKIVLRRLDLMAAEGVRFETGIEVGANLDWNEVRRNHDAVVVAIGSTTPRNLPIEGRDLANIHFAMDYLSANTKSYLDTRHDDHRYINAQDLDVVVIGGGDTGTDCVATALRQGARSITQLEILPQPPDSRAANNPWPEWPRVARLDYGQEEVLALKGKDPRNFQVTATRFEGDAAGKVCALHLVDVEWRVHESGQMRPVNVAGTERTIKAQLVLLAMGFLGPQKEHVSKFGIELNDRGNIDSKPRSYATSAQGIFCAGDAHRGQSLVVWAIMEGRLAAREVDTWLMGSSRLPR